MMETWSSFLDFSRIQQQYGTPIYLFYPEQLIHNIEDYLKLVNDPVNIAYPIKACPSMPVLQVISRYGLSIDCAAPSEINMALEAGVPYQRIWYNSPDLCIETAQKIVNCGGTLVVNDVEQLILLTFLETRPAGNIFLRWNPDIEAENNRYENNLTGHGRRSSQFGSNREAILELPLTALKCIDGLHTHIGSRITSLSLFAEAVHRLHDLVDEIFNLSGHKISWLNIGGGLRLAMNNDDICPSICELSLFLNTLFRNDIRYTIEPGNTLVGNTMGLLSSVKTIKTRLDGGNFAIVDVGSNQLLKYTLSGIAPSILMKHGDRLPDDGSDAIAGPLCFAGDVILPKTCLMGLQPGDPIFIQHCGAYCMSLSNQFNGRYRPAVLSIEKDGREYISQQAEELWFNASASAGLIWHADRLGREFQYAIDVPELLMPSVTVLSAIKTGERTYCFHISFQHTLSTLQKLSMIFRLAEAMIGDLHPGKRLAETNGLVLLSQLEFDFSNKASFLLYLSAGSQTSQGMRISFGNERSLMGFFRAHVLKLDV
ncbi:TPA: hypothetical protein LVL87_005100 [Klebsiella oxytoca]|nr:hypothetical protein [Klebsiella oxytoca]